MTIETPDWVHDAIFYQIFPDRFARSEQLNDGLTFEDWNSPPTIHGFKGGDLYGVANRLDDLVELGVTAIYLNPIFSSACNHRYHTYDYFQVDPLLGGNDALRHLLEEARERGMKIILDGVFNHCGRGFWQFHHVLENGRQSPFVDWFWFDPDRLNGDRPFVPYPDEHAKQDLLRGIGSYEAVGYAAWWNLPALPKFNVTTPAVREFLLSVAEHWIRFGIDGWRLDVPNEIDDDDFWRAFRHRVRAINPEAYIVGEVWGDGRRWLSGDMWDGVMNYQLTAACLGFFGGERLDLDETRRPSSFGHVRPIAAAEFAREVERLESHFPPEILQSHLNLLDSHDTPRFLTCVRGDLASLKLAWLFLCTQPGAPCIYYGDEIGLEGRQDPDSRRAFPASLEFGNFTLRDWYRDCIRLRKKHPALRQGIRRTLLADRAVYVSVHECVDDCVVAGFNTGEEAATVSVEFDSIDSGVCLKDVWRPWPVTDTGTTPELIKGQMTLSIPPRSAIVLT